MTAKEYLMQLYTITREIKLAYDEIAELRTFAAKTTVTFGEERVSGTGPKDRLGNVMTTIYEREQALLVKIREYNKKRAEIISLISSIPIPRYREILMRRYVMARTYDQLAEEMHYSRRNITYLLNDALEYFALNCTYNV